MRGEGDGYIGFDEAFPRLETPGQDDVEYGGVFDIVGESFDPPIADEED